MNFKSLQIDIVKDISSFHNDIVPFAHLFSSGFLNASRFTIPSFIGWARNKVIQEQDGQIGDWRKRALPASPCDSSNCDIPFENAVLVTPLIAPNAVHDSKEGSDGMTSFWSCFPIFPHEKAFHRSLIVFTEASVQTFIAQRIRSPRKSLFIGATLQHVRNKIAKFVQETGSWCLDLESPTSKPLTELCSRPETSISACRATARYWLHLEKILIRIWIG